MYEMQEKVRDPIMVLFMEIDGRIENAIKLIVEDEDIPKMDIQKLINDKESLLKIFEGQVKESKEIQYNKIWSANNLINKIDYIIDIHSTN
jgi:hypothetical protein